MYYQYNIKGFKLDLSDHRIKTRVIAFGNYWKTLKVDPI